MCGTQSVVSTAVWPAFLGTASRPDRASARSAAVELIVAPVFFTRQGSADRNAAKPDFCGWGASGSVCEAELRSCASHAGTATSASASATSGAAGIRSSACGLCAQPVLLRGNVSLGKSRSLIAWTQICMLSKRKPDLLPDSTASIGANGAARYTLQLGRGFVAKGYILLPLPGNSIAGSMFLDLCKQHDL